MVTIRVGFIFSLRDITLTTLRRDYSSVSVFGRAFRSGNNALPFKANVAIARAPKRGINLPRENKAAEAAL